MARAWGNLSFGVQQISQNDYQSEMKAYCWDLENNVKREIRFIVEHVRFTRKDGKKPLIDPRDIYENNMNQAARRLRKCILDLIPGDFVDTAVTHCQKTLGSAGDIQQRLNAMVEEYAKLGVTVDMIEGRLGHSLKAIMPAEFVQLRTIFGSIRDGVSGIEEWFEIPHDPKKIIDTQKEDSKEKAKPKANANKKTEIDIARETFVKSCEKSTDLKIDFIAELGIKNVNQVLMLDDPDKIGVYTDILEEAIGKVGK
jgi:hypothetical protein